MTLHPKFPTFPYELRLAEHHWFPATEKLRTTSYEKLLSVGQKSFEQHRPATFSALASSFMGCKD